MQQLEKPIGILGGTFDPIHHGHLRTALEIYEELNCKEIRFIPCKQPVHRGTPIASLQQRLDMLNLALTAQPGFLLDTREIQRDTPSYTLFTLISLREEFPHVPLCLIMGVDAFLTLDTWHHWQEIIHYAHIIVAQRPPVHLSELASGTPVHQLLQKHLITDKSLLSQSLAGHIICEPTTPLEISASYIRKQIHSNKNIHYLLPEQISNYIEQHQIYR